MVKISKKRQAELDNYYKELVPVMLIKDRSKKDDVTVTVNGVNYQIQRGVPVMVPRCVGLALERARKQEMDAQEYVDSLKG